MALWLGIPHEPAHEPICLARKPFVGSGTTAVACAHEGLECVGVEREAEYVEIAKARLRAA